MAQRGGGRQKEPQRRAQQRDQPRQFQERVSRNPDEAISEAKGRVGKLELGEDDPSSDRVEGGSPSGTIAGTGAPSGRSHQGHEDVHREVEETSGFGSRRDHQGARRCRRHKPS